MSHAALNPKGLLSLDPFGSVMEEGGTGDFVRMDFAGGIFWWMGVGTASAYWRFQDQIFTMYVVCVGCER